jgi:3'-phosphoadenosine 5'-phosphosulfate sulfotransferase (PAPS reductase)/FAD synthetase
VAERALLDKLAGRRVVASVSGGKDSAALSLWLKGQSIEHDRVFMDTGWEHPATYEYLRGELTRVIGPITEIRADLQMVDLIRKKKMFPSRLQRFCTTELKVRPMQRFIRSLQDGGVEPVNAVGIRREESASRSAATEWEWTDAFDCEVWRPLVAWTEAQVVAIHAKHDLRPNPLYLQGASRVGCWPCIHARKNEIRLVADVDPRPVRRLHALGPLRHRSSDVTDLFGHVAPATEPPDGEKGREERDAWFTPELLALAICRSLRDEVHRSPAHILEPGCGGGAFLRAARLTWPKAKLTGIDLVPACDRPGPDHPRRHLRAAPPLQRLAAHCREPALQLRGAVRAALHLAARAGRPSRVPAAGCVPRQRLARAVLPRASAALPAADRAAADLQQRRGVRPDRVRRLRLAAGLQGRGEILPPLVWR